MDERCLFGVRVEDHDFQQTADAIRPDDQQKMRRLVLVANQVPNCVEHVVVGDPVFPGRVRDVHSINLS